jgi:hypothetical protein
MKRNRKAFIKYFPKFFIKIPPIFMDAHSRDDLPGQNTLTAEFIELLGLE